MSVEATELLEVERAEGVVTLCLNRPAQRNALSRALMRELTSALTAVGEDPDVRVVVLAARGPAFSAGHDLSELVGMGHEECRDVFGLCATLMNAIHDLPQPVIARVHGMATAAGCQLVAACDLVVASHAARFATPGVKIGLFCTTPMVEVTRTIGRKRALEMLLTGTPIDAETAAAWGLVNRVVAPDELEAATGELARQIASASSLTIGIGKGAFYRQIDLGLDAAYELCSEVMTDNAAAEDAQEGMSAFLEKRTPTWRGR
jgi:enoyl-CoA hydratase/carnithine racemase